METFLSVGLAALTLALITVFVLSGLGKWYRHQEGDRDTPTRLEWSRWGMGLGVSTYLLGRLWEAAPLLEMGQIVAIGAAVFSIWFYIRQWSESRSG